VVLSSLTLVSPSEPVIRSHFLDAKLLQAVLTDGNPFVFFKHFVLIHNLFSIPVDSNLFCGFSYFEN
jgi:hypothetical protein